MRNPYRLALVLIVLGAASAAHADRSDTIGRLTSVDSRWDSAELAVRINDGETDVLNVGERIRYRFSSEKDAYLTVINVDSTGVLTLVLPNGRAGSNRVAAGSELTLPGDGDRFRFEATPPVGPQTLLVFATRQPVTLADYGFEAGETFFVADSPKAPSVAERVAEVLRSRGSAATAMVSLEHFIKPPEEGYTAAQIVAFYEERKRSISRPKLDLHVTFELDSARLTPQARLQVDEFATALRKDGMSGQFMLGGHADRRGDEAYNMELSTNRAHAVKDYLVNVHGIEARRLDARGFGETRPLDPRDNEDAYSVNRRVEFELVR